MGHTFLILILLGLDLRRICVGLKENLGGGEKDEEGAMKGKRMKGEC